MGTLDLFEKLEVIIQVVTSQPRILYDAEYGIHTSCVWPQ